MGICLSRSATKQPSRVRAGSGPESDRRPYNQLPYTEWDSDHVSEWLTDNNLGDLVPLFAKQHITGEILPLLGEDDLEKMNITKIGDKLGFKKTLKTLLETPTSTAPATGELTPRQHHAPPPTTVPLNHKNRQSVGSQSAITTSHSRHNPQQSLTPSYHNTNPSSSFTSHRSNISTGTDVTEEIKDHFADDEQYQAVDPQKLEQMKETYHLTKKAQGPPRRQHTQPTNMLPNTTMYDPEPSIGSLSIHSQSRTFKPPRRAVSPDSRHTRDVSMGSTSSKRGKPYKDHRKLEKGARNENSHSNPSLNMQSQGTLQKGQQVEVLSQTLNQWVSGHIERIEPSGRVLIQYLDRIRVFELNSDHLRITQPQQQTIQHPRGVPAEEQETFELAHTLYQTQAFLLSTPASASNNPTHKFTGAALTTFIVEQLHHQFQGDPVQLAQKFLNFGYIRPLKTNRGTSAKSGFVADSNVHYCFHPDKQLMFQQLDFPDRVAWTLHTEVEVYSVSLQAWQPGIITEIKPLLVYVQYGPKDAQYGKVVQRYSQSVKSSDEFKRTRQSWTVDSRVQVLSKSTNQWCSGVITKVVDTDSSQLFMVKYTSYVDGEEKTLTKWMERWSPDLKDISFDFERTAERWGL